MQAGAARVVAASLAAVLLSLESAQREIQSAIKAHLKAHPALKAKKQRLLSVPGIGRQTVLHVLVLLARWETLTEGSGRAKGLVVYTGLDPQTHDSGSSVHKPARISRMGNRQMRRRLYLAAFGGVRARGGPLRDFYGRLVGRGKAKKLALIAAARKILIWAGLSIVPRKTLILSGMSNRSCNPLDFNERIFHRPGVSGRHRPRRLANGNRGAARSIPETPLLSPL